jgi:AcrR family transcriptional regulator
MKKTDVDQKLIKAFFHSLENKHYSKISVTDLITEADCSRTTFYRHYTDVLDMYNKICEKMIDLFLSELVTEFEKDDYNLSEVLEELCDKLESQEYYIRLLCGENGGRKFFEIAFEKAVVCADILNPSLDENKSFIFKFIVCSGIGAYVKSLVHSENFDLNTLEKYKEIISGTMKGSLTLE